MFGQVLLWHGLLQKIKGGGKSCEICGSKNHGDGDETKEKDKKKGTGKSEDILFSWTCKIQAQILALNTKPASYAVIMVTV